MENQGHSKQLKPLPPSNHAWWKGARKFKAEPRQDNKCDCFFEMKGAYMKCKECSISYMRHRLIGIKDGKLIPV